jgi:UDP-N-acetylglucosamine--N-acetylmuramyl-(pentapeptide) pyrophosphoryl-undecaprenol N-acetylglucosamine transferase
MNVLLTGGGTGGHVYPALAVAEALRDRAPGSRVLFVGSRSGMEASLVPASGIPFAGLRVQPPRSQRLDRTALALLTGAGSLVDALGLLLRFRPDVVVATGGVAAAPAVLAGWALRVPVVVLEGNVVPGRANRLLARFCREVCVAWEETAAHFPGRAVTVTGLPVRREVYAAQRAEGIRHFRLDPARRTVVVLGGSQGAAPLNRAVEEAVARLGGRPDLQVLHQVGRGWEGGGEEQARYEAREAGRVLYVRVPYLDRIGLAYACADLVVSRCGATAIAEIAAAGRPAILVPYRYAAGGHQEDNARPLVRAGAAVLLRDGDLGGEVLAREIGALLDTPGRLTAMAACARSLGRPHAAARVLDILFALGRPRVAEALR